MCTYVFIDRTILLRDYVLQHDIRVYNPTLRLGKIKKKEN